MPTYDYKCARCKKIFEKLQSMKDKPLKHCIYCKGKVERLIGAGAGLIFKGTGFYITDYKHKGVKSKESKKESAPAPSSETKPKSDTGAKK